MRFLLREVNGISQNCTNQAYFLTDLAVDIQTLKERNDQLKVSLAVQGSNEAFSLMASNTVRRNIFTSSLYQVLTQYGFDGLVVHWNKPGRNDKDSFVTLVQVFIEVLIYFQKLTWKCHVRTLKL